MSLIDILFLEECAEKSRESGYDFYYQISQNIEVLVLHSGRKWSIEYLEDETATENGTVEDIF